MTTAKNIVLNEGSGVIINKLFNQWDKIKSQKDQDVWSKKIAGVKFGTYNTYSFLEIMDIFKPNFPSVFLKESFLNEINSAIKKYN